MQERHAVSIWMIATELFWHTERALDKSVFIRTSGAFAFKLRHSLPTLILVAAGIAHVPFNFHVNTSVKDALSAWFLWSGWRTCVDPTSVATEGSGYRARSWGAG